MLQTITLILLTSLAVFFMSAAYLEAVAIDRQHKAAIGTDNTQTTYCQRHRKWMSRLYIGAGVISSVLLLLLIISAFVGL